MIKSKISLMIISKLNNDLSPKIPNEMTIRNLYLTFIESKKLLLGM